MQLIGDLKNQVEKANSKEEAKEIIADAGMMLTDDELNMVTGGKSDKGIVGICPECGELAFQIPLPNGERQCDACGRTYDRELALQFESLFHRR